MKNLKNILVTLLVVLGLTSCVSVNKSNMEFVNSDEFDSKSSMVAVNVPMVLAKPFVVKSLKKDKESAETIALMKSVKKVKILAMDQSNGTVTENFETYKKQNGLEELLTINNEGNEVKLIGAQDQDELNRLLLNVKSSDGEMVFIDLKGKFKKSDLAKLMK